MSENAAETPEPVENASAPTGPIRFPVENQTYQAARFIVDNAEVVGNAMTMRSDLLNKLFDPRRDIDVECGYPKSISIDQYRAMYDRELGQRVVNVYPEETWKQMPLIKEESESDTPTDFDTALRRVAKRRHLMHYLQRADEMSGIGQYGVILWGLSDGKPLKEPVAGSESWAETTGADEIGTAQIDGVRLIYIRVFDASVVRISSYVQDEMSPRYGKPEFYTIQFMDPRNQELGATTSPPNYTETQIHWSRITHIADNRKNDEITGQPRMMPVWNRLYDLRKVLGGTGEMFWRGGFPGISLETQPGNENAVIDQAKTREEMHRYGEGLQRFIALTGMTAKSLSPQLADPSMAFEIEIKAVCVTIGVPYRIFMGIEEGVVAGDQATKSWDTRLKNRQNKYVTPMIIDPAIERLVEYGVLPKPGEDGWKTVWPDLSQQDAESRARTAVRLTEAMVKYIQGGADQIMPPMKFLTKILGQSEEDAREILEAASAYLADLDDEEDTEGTEAFERRGQGDSTGGGASDGDPIVAGGEPGEEAQRKESRLA